MTYMLKIAEGTSRTTSRDDRKAQLKAEARRYGLHVVRPAQLASWTVNPDGPRPRPAA